MKSFTGTIVFITLAAVFLFILNIFVMSVFFNVDILHPARETLPENENLQYKNQYIDNKSTEETTTGEDDSIYRNTENDQVNGIDKGVVAAGNYIGNPNLPGEGMDTENPKCGEPSGYYMTTADINSLENLNLIDKIEAMALISKINSDEAEKIYDMTLDGVTFDEKQEIQSMLGKYLTAEEIQKLLDILEKKK